MSIIGCMLTDPGQAVARLYNEELPAAKRTYASQRRFEVMGQALNRPEFANIAPLTANLLELQTTDWLTPSNVESASFTDRFISACLQWMRLGGRLYMVNDPYQYNDPTNGVAERARKTLVLGPVECAAIIKIYNDQKRSIDARTARRMYYFWCNQQVPIDELVDDKAPVRSIYFVLHHSNTKYTVFEFEVTVKVDLSTPDREETVRGRFKVYASYTYHRNGKNIARIGPRDIVLEEPLRQWACALLGLNENNMDPSAHDGDLVPHVDDQWQDLVALMWVQQCLDNHFPLHQQLDPLAFTPEAMIEARQSLTVLLFEYIFLAAPLSQPSPSVSRRSATYGPLIIHVLGNVSTELIDRIRNSDQHSLGFINTLTVREIVRQRLIKKGEIKQGVPIKPDSVENRLISHEVLQLRDELIVSSKKRVLIFVGEAVIIHFPDYAFYVTPSDAEVKAVKATLKTKAEKKDYDKKRQAVEARYLKKVHVIAVKSDEIEESLLGIDGVARAAAKQEIEKPFYDLVAGAPPVNHIAPSSSDKALSSSNDADLRRRMNLLLDAYKHGAFAMEKMRLDYFVWQEAFAGGPLSAIAGLCVEQDALQSQLGMRCTSIWAVTTHPLYQGRGYATKMLRFMIEWVSTHVESNNLVLPLVLAVAIDNKPAISLYKQLGFALGWNGEARKFANTMAYLMTYDIVPASKMATTESKQTLATSSMDEKE